MSQKIRFMVLDKTEMPVLYYTTVIGGMIITKMLL